MDSFSLHRSRVAPTNEPHRKGEKVSKRKKKERKKKIQRRRSDRGRKQMHTSKEAFKIWIDRYALVRMFKNAIRGKRDILHCIRHRNISHGMEWGCVCAWLVGLLVAAIGWSAESDVGHKMQRIALPLRRGRPGSRLAAVGSWLDRRAAGIIVKTVGKTVPGGDGSALPNKIQWRSEKVAKVSSSQAGFTCKKEFINHRFIDMMCACGRPIQ